MSRNCLMVSRGLILLSFTVVGFGQPVERLQAAESDANRDPDDRAGEWTAIEANDLTEWSNPGRWWKASNGVFVADSPGGPKLPKVHYLVWNGTTGQDFELSLEYRIIAKQPQDAGVTFRVERPFARRKPNLPGYQAELDTAYLYSTKPGIQQGKLFGNIHDGKRSHMFKRSTRTVIDRAGKMTTSPLDSDFRPAQVFRRPPQWNQCVVQADGDHIRLMLNDVPANEIIDRDTRNSSTGQAIALQFRPRFSYRFEVRNLKFRPIQSAANSKEPPSPSPTPSSADPNTLAERGEWPQAAQEFEKLFAADPAAMTTMAGLRLAAVYARLEQKEKHKELCRRLFRSFRDWKKPADAERPAKAYLLYPGADDAELLRQAQRGTRDAVKAGRGWIRVWFELSQGMAEYRLGKYADAEKSLNRPRQSKNPGQRIPAHAFSAMVAFQQGRSDAARELLAKAVNDYRSFSDSDGDWQNVLAAGLAIEEAQALIE